MRFRKWLLALGLTLLTLALQVTSVRADSVHTVQPGENLQRIAARYGTSVAAILDANGLVDRDVVHPGQRLRIPSRTESAGTSTRTYVVQSGETLFSIARRLGASQIALMQINGLSDASFIRAGQRLTIPHSATVALEQLPIVHTTAGPRVYVIARGDTLFSIAARHGTTVGALAQANNLAFPSQIFRGQRLVVPGRSVPAPEPAVPTSGRWIDIDTT